jgi:hypothetical protein
MEQWRKSSYSNGQGGECVEVRDGIVRTTGAVPVRDSKDVSRGSLAVPAASWSALLSDIQA